MTDPLAHAPLDAANDRDGSGPDLQHLVVGGISRSWRWVLTLTALGAAVGLAIGIAQPNEYGSEAKLLLRVGARERASSESMIGPGGGAESPASVPTMFDEVQMLSDVAVYEKVARALGPQSVLQPVDPSEGDGPDTPFYIRAMHALQGGSFAVLPNDHDCPGATCPKCIERATKKRVNDTSIGSEDGSNVIVVRSVATSPQAAQRTVQALADAFIERHRQQFSISALVEKNRPKVEQARKDRDAAALSYLEHINKTGVGEVETQSPTYLAELNSLEDKLWDAKLQLEQLRQQRKSLVERVQEPAGPVTLFGPVLMIPNEQFETLQEQKLGLIAERRAVPAPSASRSREIDNRIAEIDQALARTPRTVAKATESRRMLEGGAGAPPVAAGLQEDEHSLELRVQALTDRYEEKKAKSNEARRQNLLAEQQRKDLAASRDIAETRYEQMQERFSMLEALGAIDINDDANLRLMQTPTLEPEKIGPKRASLLFKGLLAGFFVGIVVAIVRQKLDRRLRYPELFERQRGVAVLGVVPRLASLRELPDPAGGAR